MISTTEFERLAAMGNALRPDWPVSSLFTHLTREHSHRAYRDVAVALAWIACDQDTATPARMKEDGPWWLATRETAPTPTPPGRCVRCGTFHTAPECARPAGDVAAGVSTVRAALAKAKADVAAAREARL